MINDQHLPPHLRGKKVSQVSKPWHRVLFVVIMVLMFGLIGLLSYTDSLATRAYALITRGDYAKAETLYLRVLKLQPKHARALGNLAELYTKQQRYAEAEALYFQMLEQDAVGVRSVRFVGLVALSSTKLPTKEATAAQARIYQALAQLYIKQQRMEDAIAMYEIVLELKLGDARVQEDLKRLKEQTVKE
jgi:tetratricopeptide (TPR) repeat protein